MTATPVKFVNPLENHHPYFEYKDICIYGIRVDDLEQRIRIKKILIAVIAIVQVPVCVMVYKLTSYHTLSDTFIKTAALDFGIIVFSGLCLSFTYGCVLYLYMELRSTYTSELLQLERLAETKSKFSKTINNQIKCIDWKTIQQYFEALEKTFQDDSDDQLKCRAYKVYFQNEPTSIPPEERIKFLATQSDNFVEIQGRLFQKTLLTRQQMSDKNINDALLAYD